MDDELAEKVNDEKTQPRIDSRSQEIRIWLDDYDDLFSDFDPRSFSLRAISDDFLHELKKRSRENEFDINVLKLLLPSKKRNKTNESLITKRLHAHFKNNFQLSLKNVRYVRNKAAAFLLLGFIIMAVASYISFLKSDKFVMNLLLVLLEPAGWFSVWHGFDDLFSTTKRETPDLNFYTKILKCRIVFESIQTTESLQSN